MIAQWKTRLSSCAHPDKFKVILDGIKDMEKSGISFSSVSPSEPESDLSSLPVYSAEAKPETIALPRENSGIDNTNLANRVGFDPKNLYRNVKRLLVKLDEYGDNLFLQPEARVSLVLPLDLQDMCMMCTLSQPELQDLIHREVMLGTNEKLINRLLLVNDLITKVNERYNQFLKKNSLLGGLVRRRSSAAHGALLQPSPRGPGRV